jgi:hypothetical protein
METQAVSPCQPVMGVVIMPYYMKKNKNVKIFF